VRFNESDDFIGSIVLTIDIYDCEHLLARLHARIDEGRYPLIR
jgi:hypothetical protein